MSPETIKFAVGALLISAVVGSYVASKAKKDEKFYGVWVAGTVIIYSIFWGIRLIAQSCL